MRLLVPRAHIADRHLVRAAKNMGHEVHVLHSMPEHYLAMFAGCAPDRWEALETQHDLAMTTPLYQWWYHEYMWDYIHEHSINGILPSAASDFLLTEIAELNSGLLGGGIRPDAAMIFANKGIYGDMLLTSGVPVPALYDFAEPGGVLSGEPVEFPAICKPTRGSGGKGIFVANNQAELDWFFGPSDRPEDFSERAAKVHDRLEDGSLRNYLYHSDGGHYIVQEFVQGDCVSLAGTSQQGKLTLDLVHDVGVTDLPYRSETVFAYPSVHDAHEAALSLTEKLQEALPFPSGAWMADCIWDGEELVVVDVACRMSISAMNVFAHSCGDPVAYPTRILHAFLGEEPTPCELDKAVYHAAIDLPKGEIANIEYPDASELREVQPARKRIYEARNDVQTLDRGWMVGTGDTREEAQEKVERYASRIKVEMK